LRANAALDRNLIRVKLTAKEQVLLAEVESMLKRTESTDKEEDDRFGDDSGNSLPKIDSTKERLALIRRACRPAFCQSRNALSGPMACPSSSIKISIMLISMEY